MAEELPKFKYHPDPIATGMINASNDECPCCNKKRGYAYSKMPYCTQDIENLCPWCIGDGTAAEKYDATFSDGHPLKRAGISDEITEEVTKRTPGFISWQEDEWLSCCNDACEFHGDISVNELKNLDADTMARFRREHDYMDDEDFASLPEYYEPGGQPAIYKFVCRHCGKIHLGMDFT